MGHLPQIITDLALLLIVAAIVTIIFKKIKQPVVLGYIIVGVLIGPNLGISWLPSIVDTENITVWADIGVIFLMFGLGLEFSFTKLANVGSSAIITAITEMVFMILAGFLVGSLLGWSTMNSIFLGAMLAISSTTIIIKAFDELGMRGQKFTDLVFGTLVVEDIVGIFIMVLLSTIAVSQNISGGAIAMQIGQMALYLVLWFVLSIFLIPTLLKKAKDFLSDEILLVVSVGLCLAMVVLANAIGFSSALGAFIAGSILAGTIQAERIEHLVAPLKDLFGAVFFVSVGMLVAPAMLVEHIWPIVIITVVTIILKPIFSALGVLFAGNTLRTAVYTGLSLSQIGEFSFIIAGLGVTLGVTSDFLYPVIVSVSVVTTLTTPFMIKGSDFTCNFLNRILPEKLLKKLNRYTSEDQDEIEKDSLWKRILKRYLGKIALCSVAALCIAELFARLVGPFIANYLPDPWNGIVASLIAIGILAPFLAYLFYNGRDRSFTILWFNSRSNRLPLIMLLILTLIVAVAAVAYLIYRIGNLHAAWLFIPALIIIFLISRSDWLLSRFLRLEVHFLGNLNERTLAERKEKAIEEGVRATKWLDEQLYVVHVQVPENSPGHGKSLEELVYQRFFNMTVIKIIHQGHHINIPAAKQKIYVGDEIVFVGQKEAARAFREKIDVRKFMIADEEIVTLHTFIDRQDDDDAHDNLLCFVVEAEKDSSISGKTIKDCNIKEVYHCLVLGLSRNNLPLIEPDINMRIEVGDQVWLLGDEKTATRLAASDYM